jgi:hypothetical protein
MICLLTGDCREAADLSHAYVEMTRERLTADCPLFMAFEASPPPAEDPEDERMADLFQDMAAD